MDYERDVLTRLVIPAVNERLRESGRGVVVYPVDLRWGVETDSRLDTAARQRMTLEICVSEVRRCRPLFIGLRGSKYGWVPSEHLGRAVLDAAGLADPGFPLSVTAIEVLSAVHSSDGVAPILLARRASPADLVAAAGAGVAEDGSGGGGSDLLVRFERHLAELGHAFQPYDAQWREADGRFDSADFAGLATGALLATLDAVLAGDDLGSWLDAELGAQRWAAERDARQFTGRGQELGFVADFWGHLHHYDRTESGDDPGNPLWRLRQQIGQTTLAVVGPSGCGKSALLAKAATDLKIRSVLGEADEVDRAYVRVGATAASERLPVCLLLLLAQLDPSTARAIADRCGADSLELGDVLDAWLQTLEGAMRLFGPLIVIDGLDRLVGALTESEPLAWLPITLGDRARILVSAADDSHEAGMLAHRPSTYVLNLGDLTARDAADLVGNRVLAHHKAMPSEVVDRLVHMSRSPRWLVVASELLLTLMAHDYLVLRRLKDPGSDTQSAIRRLLVSIADELPADLGLLHEEVFDRLFELLDERFLAVLGLIGVSLFGLGEQDLSAALDLLGQTPAALDLALYRDVLSVHVHVRRGDWRFAHQSAADGVERLLDEASDAIGQDARIGYRTVLVRHLLRKPVDDPVRVRELLALLALIGEDRTLVAGLGRADLATDEAVTIFGIVLSGFVRSGGIHAATRLLEAGGDDRGRLTAVQVVVAYVLPLVRQDERTELVTRCRTLLADFRPDARSRSGLTPADVLEAVDTLTADPFGPSGELEAIPGWFTDAIKRGTAALREAPGTARSRIGLSTEMRLLIEYALAVHAGQLSSADDDAEQARLRLDRWTAFLDQLDKPDPNSAEFLRLLVAVAERAAGLAWPDGGFRPDDTDFPRLSAMTDRARGNVDLVCLLGLAARVHALDRLVDLDEDEKVSPADATRIHAALGYLEQAMWQLDIQADLSPDAYAVEVTMIQCGALHSTLLSICEQYASACRSGVAVCSAPHAAELLGWPAFAQLAGDTLYAWNESYTKVDPSKLIEALTLELDRYRTTGLQLIPDPSEPLERLLLMAALTAAKRFGHFAQAVRVIDRAFTLQRCGALILPDDAPLQDVLREYLGEIEDELLEFVHDPEDVDPEDMDTVIRAVNGTFELRTVVMTHQPGEPEDNVGAAFCAAVNTSLLGQPQLRADAERLRSSVDPTTLTMRCRALLTATDELLNIRSI